MKSNMLGYEFIKNHGGEIVHYTLLGDVKVQNESEYKAFVTEHYANNKHKKEKLLMKDIPQDFLNRHLNNSQYTFPTVTYIPS